jgi:peptidoglycan/xylan/chitin deacetylase (PgdA/CDA1 family)
MARRVLPALLLVPFLLTGCTGSPRAAASPSPSPSASPSPSPSPSPTGPPARPLPTLLEKTGSRAIALTFDDGPQNEWTGRVLDELKAHQVKATFCLIGSQIAEHADLVRRIVAEGHTLCNHTWNHEMSLGRASDAAIKANLIRTDDAIHAVVPGVPIPYFRQPGGIWTAAIHRVVKQLGKQSLGWSVDPSDWRRPGTSTIVKRIIGATRPGSIVLMHDGGGDRSQSWAALRQILPALIAKNYILIPLPVPPVYPAPELVALPATPTP